LFSRSRFARIFASIGSRAAIAARLAAPTSSLSLALVLPAEVAALPDVGEAEGVLGGDDAGEGELL
jgi:hypothetical protein